MNLQESIKYLRPIAASTPMSNYSKALKMVMAAAGKMVRRSMEVVDIDGQKGYVCPQCELIMVPSATKSKRYKHCPECGQALKWQEDKSNE